jgi:hypothetical protein
MPGLIWSSKGEVLSGGADVPDGSADGQFLLWNAAAGEWQAQSITPGDIGAAEAVHTHDWLYITTYGNVSARGDAHTVYAGATRNIGTISYYTSAALFLIERKVLTIPQTVHFSIFMLSKNGAYIHQATGAAVGTISVVSNTVRYTATAEVSLHWLYLPFGDWTA